MRSFKVQVENKVVYLEFLGIFIHSGFINPALCCVPQM